MTRPILNSEAFATPHEKLFLRSVVEPTPPKQRSGLWLVAIGLVVVVVAKIGGLI